jgi:hypothetical protein
LRLWLLLRRAALHLSFALTVYLVALSFDVFRVLLASLAAYLFGLLRAFSFGGQRGRSGVCR